jgi:Domain of unknown function (DUF5979)
MISLRKAAALTAVSALSLVGFSGIASAQSQSQITINVKVGDPKPAAVSGYNITTTCNNLFGTGGSQSTTTSVAAAGGTGNQFYTLTATSGCTVTVTPVGTATGANATISIGGTVRGSGSLPLTSSVTAVNAATTVDINIAYPSFKVKKVVVGEEITAGVDYDMAAVCYYNNFALAGSVKFKLKAGAERTFSVADMPGLVAGATCHVTELTNGGAAGTSISSTNADGTTGSAINLPVVFGDGVQFNPFTTAGICAATFADGVCRTPIAFASAGFKADGQTATVTNTFTGDLIVSKVVTGDPKSNIAVYEINVSCNAGGPRESFLLKDRQSKVFTGIPTGASCLVSETRSDGATASYSDNSGDNTTDGRVTIKGSASGCIDKNINTFPDCRANVIVTNSYVVATTTAAPTTAAPVTAAPTTAAPVAPAPVEEPAELAEEEETVG